MFLNILSVIAWFLLSGVLFLGILALVGLIRNNIRGDVDMVGMNVIIEASSHCCGIYQMQGVRYASPPSDVYDIESIIKKTEWNEKTCTIILFSDIPSGNGEKWREKLISLGYRVDKFDLGLNPKTTSRLFLYHWYVTPVDKNKATKISMIREYSYEEEQRQPPKIPSPNKSKPGIVKGGRTFLRGKLGRFVRRSP